MPVLQRGRWALSVTVVAALAVGCGGSEPPAAAPSPSLLATPTATPRVVVYTETRPLPNMPDEGLIIDVAGVATFRSMDGTTQVPLPGFRLDGGIVTGSLTWLRAKDGSTWFLDTQARQLVKQEVRHDAADGLDLLAGLPRAERTGQWRFALPGPDGQLLAQWSGECEVPSVYVADRRHRLRRVSPTGTQVNAYARGWTRSGRPIVEFPDAPCGTGLRGPGMYLETRPSHYRLLARTNAGAYYRLPAAADATRVALCGPGAYSLKAVAEGATGNAAVGAEVHPATTTACRLDVVITVALRDSAKDQLLGVPSNLVRIRVRGTLPNIDGMHADAVWQQPYCPSTIVDLVVEDGRGNSDTLPDIQHPRCDPAAGQTGAGSGLASIAR